MAAKNEYSAVSLYLVYNFMYGCRWGCSHKLERNYLSDGCFGKIHELLRLMPFVLVDQRKNLFPFLPGDGQKDVYRLINMNKLEDTG